MNTALCRTEFPYRESVLYRSDEEKAAVIRVIAETGFAFRTQDSWKLGVHPSGFGLVLVDFAEPAFARALARSVPAGTETGPGIGPRCRRLSARRRRSLRADVLAIPKAANTGVAAMDSRR